MFLNVQKKQARASRKKLIYYYRLRGIAALAAAEMQNGKTFYETLSIDRARAHTLASRHTHGTNFFFFRFFCVDPVCERFEKDFYLQNRQLIVCCS